MIKINDDNQIADRTIKEITVEFAENLIAAQELGTEFMYQTLMEYGGQLGDYPIELMTETNLIHGCQSTVYIYGDKTGNNVFYKGFADSKLVQGQVAILLKIFNGQNSEDIIHHSKDILDNFVNSTNIIASLTPSRQNAFGSMYEHIKKIAQQ